MIAHLLSQDAHAEVTAANLLERLDLEQLDISNRLQAEQAAAGKACFVDVYLACEHEFPAKLLGVAHVLGVEFFDRLGMGARQRSTT